MTNSGDDTPDLGVRDLSRTLQYDTPASTTLSEEITSDTPRQPDYEAMNNLMKKDLADLRETQRQEHAQMIAALARCEELETQARENARANEAQFFAPIDRNQPSPNVIQIPVTLNPSSLQH
jgi:hypothetical protein